jgi:hypothetical protein
MTWRNDDAADRLMMKDLETPQPAVYNDDATTWRNDVTQRCEYDVC